MKSPRPHPVFASRSLAMHDYRDLFPTYRLTRQEALVLHFLAGFDKVASTRLHRALYDDLPPQRLKPGRKIINTHICMLRKKIQPLRIDTIWGWGYRMPPGCRASLKAQMKPEADVLTSVEE